MWTRVNQSSGTGRAIFSSCGIAHSKRQGMWARVKMSSGPGGSISVRLGQNE